MANPPDFRDLNRQKNSKALQFASIDEKLRKGVGSRVGSGQPPAPPASPTPTISLTPSNSPSLTPSTTPPVPSPTPTNTPAVLPNVLFGPGSSASNGVYFISLNNEAIFFNGTIEQIVPVSMDIYYNDQVVASVTFDSERVGTPFKFVLDYNNPGQNYFYGNFIAGAIYFTGGPLPTPSITPSISITPSPTPTPTVTETPLETPPAPTPEATPTPTPGPTGTPFETPTLTPSITVSSSIPATPTPTSSRTPTVSLTPTNTPTMTDGASPTPTPSPTPSVTPTLPYVTSYPSNSVITSDGVTQETAFIVNYGVVTGDPVGNISVTVSPNNTLVSVEAYYLDGNGAPYGTLFIPYNTVTDTFTFELTTFTDIEGSQFYELINPSGTDEAHHILPEIGDFQVLFVVTAQSGEPGSYDWSLDTGAFVDINTTPTPTPTISVTPSVTVSETPPQTPTQSITPSITPSNTIGVTRTPTPTISLTISNTPSITPSNTIGVTPTPTPTISLTPSNTVGVTRTPTPTKSPTMTPSVTLTPGHGPIYGALPVYASPSSVDLVQSFYVNVGKEDVLLSVDFDPGAVSTNFEVTVPVDNSINITTGYISSLSSFATGLYPSSYGVYDLLLMVTVTAVDSPDWMVTVNTSPLV